MNSVRSIFISISAIALSAALALPAIAQSSQTPAAPPQANNASASPSDTGTYATGQPLSTQSNEGFWGKLNPLARKKWVRRQVNPVKDRLNELDQLSAKNAADIKDVDARAQAGIQKAQSTADQASQQATQANAQANQAQQTAQQASTETAQLNTTVSNLDQYQRILDTEIRFRPTQTALNDKAKAALDVVATQLAGQKGYIVDVQGYSPVRGRVGIQRSQNMADAVVRYLVEDHHVPVYRIYRVAMGNAPVPSETTNTTDTTPTTRSSMRDTVVHVTLMHNSLAALNVPNNGSSPIGATQQ